MFQETAAQGDFRRPRPLGDAGAEGEGDFSGFAGGECGALVAGEGACGQAARAVLQHQLAGDVHSPRPGVAYLGAQLGQATAIACGNEVGDAEVGGLFATRADVQVDAGADAQDHARRHTDGPFGGAFPVMMESIHVLLLTR
ncbi:hypothetical protein [Streptomyces sp. NBC_00057]|uniref:hypothetical protein n=1 Tax=Streptomyces sp. NBC_00057 TaxID=2975634 RepID=UPI00325148AA